MTDTPLILAFDPSLSDTGYAALEGDRLISCGLISPSAALGMDLVVRARSILEDAQDLVEEYEPNVVVVELPQTFHLKSAGARCLATLPNYGFICGALALGLVCAKAVRRLYPSASLWTQRAPGTKGDPCKVRRVRWVEGMYGLKQGELGPKTTAGNVADAVLMARWAQAAFLEYEGRLPR